MSVSSTPPQEIVIIRRKGGGDDDGHHGGVWKIAFADFMTAMMAFFLVLWIVNSSSKETRSSIARYFNPVKLADTTPARKGLQDAKELDFDASEGDVGGPKKDDPCGPVDVTGKDGTTKAAKTDSHKTDSHKTDSHKAESPKVDPHKKEDGKGHGKPDDGGKSAKKSLPPGCVDQQKAVSTQGQQPRYSEEALFNDPQAILSEIEKEAQGAAAGKPAVIAPIEVPSRLEMTLAFKDPFEPVSPVLVTREAVEPTGKPGKTQPVKFDKQALPELQSAPAETVLIEEIGSVEPPPKRMTFKPSPWSKAEVQESSALDQGKQADRTRLQADLAQSLKDELSTRAGPGIEIRAVPEGTLLSLTDDLNFAMFAIGSAEPHPQAIKIMEKIAQVLSKHDGMIVVRGHTDGRQYANGRKDAGRYDNWRLSADRAQMSYHMLARGGLAPQRLDRIEGHADRKLKRSADPAAAENRRIEILIRADKS